MLAQPRRPGVVGEERFVVGPQMRDEPPQPVAARAAAPFESDERSYANENNLRSTLYDHAIDPDENENRADDAPVVAELHDKMWRELPPPPVPFPFAEPAARD